MVIESIPKLVGARVKRREDPRLITGNATYVDNVRLPGMQHLAVLRSPYAHARIRGIDVSKARALPGVVMVVTGEDLRGRVASLLKRPERWPLALGRVRYVGEPVAAVLARDQATARDAIDLLDVDYEEMPAAVDVEQAMLEGAPRVHEQLESNIAHYAPLSMGDAEAALQKSDVRVSQRMLNQRLAPVPMETRGTVASYNQGDRTLTVWASTQVPHSLRTTLSRLLSISEERVRVIAPEVGGGFGCKGDAYPEDPLVAALAIMTGKPVKWIATRAEAMMSTTHGRDQVATVELGARQDGTITALKLHIVGVLGAYAEAGMAMMPTISALMITGCYKIPNLFAEIYGVYTNTVPTGPYRGAGRPEATYYIERAMDILADKLGMDPAELRRRNFIQPEEFPFTTPTGLLYDSGNYERSLDKALEIAGYNDLRGTQQQEQRAERASTLLGVGLATWVEICGAGPSAAMGGGGWETSMVRVERGGAVTLHTGISPHGQGQETTFAQIVGDELGVPIEQVAVLHGDTAIVTQGIGTFGSRGLAVGGGALMLSIGKVKEKAKRLAAHAMDANPDDLIFENGRISVAGSPDRGMSLPEIAAAAYNAVNLPPGEEPGLQATSFFEPPNFTFPFGAHIAVVEIDKETGEVKLARYIAVDDCGRIISPLLVAGQLHGGIAQGIGQALWEEVVYDASGQLLSGTLLDYALPTAERFPRFELDHTETPTPVNPLGAKGVGEAGTIAASPAVVNAVVDALQPYGVTHVDMPLRPERIWRLIRGRAPGDE